MERRPAARRAGAGVQHTLHTAMRRRDSRQLATKRFGVALHEHVHVRITGYTRRNMRLAIHSSTVVLIHDTSVPLQYCIQACDWRSNAGRGCARSSCSCDESDLLIRIYL